MSTKDVRICMCIWGGSHGAMSATWVESLSVIFPLSLRKRIPSICPLYSTTGLRDEKRTFIPFYCLSFFFKCGTEGRKLLEIDEKKQFENVILEHQISNLL